MLTNLGLVISLGGIQSTRNLDVCKKSVYFHSDVGILKIDFSEMEICAVCSVTANKWFWHECRLLSCLRWTGSKTLVLLFIAKLAMS